jgi:tRNA-modifying protein YgfZ
MTSGGFQPEYVAATEGAGLVSLEGWSTIRVSGGDRAAFLHNMCTNDVKGLAPGGGCEAFFTDVKGKLVAHAFILAEAESIQVVLPATRAEPLLAHLDRYLIREDVQLHDESASMSWSLLSGRHAGLVLGQLAPVEVAGLTTPWSHTIIRIGAAKVTLRRCELPWCGGYLIGVSISDLNSVHETLVERGASLTSAPIWHAIRVESAWPLWGVDFDGSNLAQEVGRDAAAIHFRKGCYLGQETVARIDALGHVNKKLVQVRFDGREAPAVAAEVSADGQVVGRVASAAWSPHWQAPLALAMVKRGANEPGSKVQCGEQSGTVTSGISAA